MEYFLNRFIKVSAKATILFFSSLLLSHTILAADYPENRDYGSKGEFMTKRGVEFGRTADLLPIGPVLINLSEAPGSSPTGLGLEGVRFEDTAWDLSDLTNPTMIRSLTCDTCFSSMPIGAHATVIRFDDQLGPLLFAGNAGDLSFDPTGATSNDQLQVNRFDDWGFSPGGYINLTAPYHVRTYWDYGFQPAGTFAIRDQSRHMQSGPDQAWSLAGTVWEDIFGPSELGVWLGEPFVYWNHLSLTGVTGFSSWLGNLLVVASDQQATGLAIYDVEGYKEGRIPRLLSVYQPELTEPNGHKVGIGGYWVESYGTNKMVFAARQRDGVTPTRDYPALYIVDFTNPTAPELSCELYFDQNSTDPSDGDGSSDPMYINFQDNYVYVDHFKVDITACEAAYADKTISAVEFAEIVYKFEDTANECDASQYFRPLGQVGVFGGYDWWRTPDVNEQGMCFFVTDDQPDTRAPFIAGHRPLANQTDYPTDGFIHLHIPETLRSETVHNSVTVTNLTNGETIDFKHQLSHTGIMSLWPEAYLAANTTYRVAVAGIQDYIGNTMDDYSFVFTTDDGMLMGPHGDDGSANGDIVPSYSETPYYANKSSQLSCEADTENADVWVVNPDNDSVSIISQHENPVIGGVSPELRREIKLGYQHPTSVSESFHGWFHLYAVTYRDDDKVIFHNSDGNPRFSIDTGHGTQPIASVVKGDLLYVALYGSDEIIEINIAAREIVNRVYVGPSPKAMAITGNRLLVTRFISSMEQGQVYDLDITQGLSLSRIININKVLVPDDIDHGMGVPNYLSSIVINQAGTTAYVSASKANVGRGLHRNGLPLDGDNTVRPMIAILDLVNNRDANVDPTTRAGTSDLDNGADPSAVTFLANPNIRVHALRGNNIVVANHLSDNTSVQFNTGMAPQDMCTTLRTLYVKNFTDRSVSAIDVAGFLYDGRLSQNVKTVNTVTAEILPAQELAGLKLFYHSRMPAMGLEGYMTCATCHAGGGHDGMTWDITNMGEGLRNTLSLNGASGTRFGNLHWSANFDEVQDFEIQMEQLNGGEGLIPGKTFSNTTSPLGHISAGLNSELDALAAYVNGLGKESVRRSPYRTYTGEFSEAALRGKTIFDDDNCGACHTGEAYRDGLTHDVGTITAASGSRLGGTLSAIRTPSLIELFDSAPYLHDGSALGLSDVFSKGTHQRAFTGNQQADLIEYLLSIDRDVYIDDE
jgi:hypothetical protein